MVAGLIGSPTPTMVEVIPQSVGKFRNLHPHRVEDAVKTHQREMFKRGI